MFGFVLYVFFNDDVVCWIFGELFGLFVIGKLKLLIGGSYGFDVIVDVYYVFEIG